MEILIVTSLILSLFCITLFYKYLKLKEDLKYLKFKSNPTSDRGFQVPTSNYRPIKLTHQREISDMETDFHQVSIHEIVDSELNKFLHNIKNNIPRTLTRDEQRRSSRLDIELTILIPKDSPKPL